MGLRSEIEDVRQQMRSEHLALVIEDTRIAIKSAKLILAQHLLEHKVQQMLLAIKANFNPAQSRVPAGNPDGGQWTNEGRNWEGMRAQYARSEGINDRRVVSDVDPEHEPIIPGADYAADGHHLVAQAEYLKAARQYGFSAEVMKVFKNAKTGRLSDPSSNLNDHMHQNYNRAVGELIQRYIRDNGIKYGQMTVQDAHKVVGEILRSRDPRLFNFHKRLIYRELRAWQRLGIRSND